MDLITDLTAEAVIFLSVFQDICKDQFRPQNLEKKKYKNLWQLDIDEIEKYNCSSIQRDRIREIIFKSTGDGQNSEEVANKTVDCFFGITRSLLAWLEAEMKDEEKVGWDDETSNPDTLLFTPYQWRKSIRRILYAKPAERATLARILHYMPIQVILCLGGRSSNSYKQRVYQVWEPSAEKELVLLNGQDEKISVAWWDAEFLGEIRRIRALKVLESDHLMLEELKRLNNPIPFETFFNSELDEIMHSREKRASDPANAKLQMNISQDSRTNDPLIRATEMKLVGLAFSGGGIRSATFNLGILQKLAENDILPRIDYLSTVSGGGYIGAWFATWIQRAGSVSKVADRLNTKKSADPMAEEVLPLRWLRMFSNYLNPDASIMSLDSWTVGITWLRNTIINQLILLLMLCTFLSLIDLLFSCWLTPVIPFGDSVSNIVWWSSGILITGCILSGLGMRMYDQGQSRWQLFNLGKYKFLSLFLTIWSIITAFMISSWLFLYAGSEKVFDFVSAPLIASVLTCILTIAFLGNYHTYPVNKWGKRLIIPLILVSSLIATLACVHLLQIVLEVFFYMCRATQITQFTNGD
jgi:hypothetical protein